MRAFLGVPVFAEGKPFGNLYLAEKKDGEEFSEEDEPVVMRLAELAGVAIDHAQRYNGVEAQRAELEHTVHALDATVQIARAVGGQTELDKIRSNGFGLHSMRERAELIGGTLETTSALGRGTEITARLPQPAATTSASRSRGRTE
jgi:GAF domain-containing protein